MRGERERQAEDRGKLRTIGARTQNPDRHLQPGAGNRLHRLAWFGRLEIAHQFHDILRKIIAGAVQRPPHRPRGDLIGTRRATQPQIDPARMQRRERAELLGDQQRSVIRQHDAAGADADAARAGRDMRQRDRGRGTGDARQVVMLGHPVAAIAQRLDMAREVERIAQRLAGVAAFDNGGEIENGKWDHPPTMTRHGPGRKPVVWAAVAGRLH